MLRAMLYKEWLKLRWAIVGLVAAFLFFAIYIWMDVRHNLMMSGTLKVWLYAIFHKWIFYSPLKLVPAIAGLVLAVFQFVPEVSKKRFRLTFHLPVDEKSSLLVMIGCGLAVQALLSILLLGSFSILNSSYFPAELLNSAWWTILPWILAGFVTYLGVALVTVEPAILNKLVFGVVSYGFVQMLLEEQIYMQYRFSLWRYTLVGLLFLLTIFYPGYRFRRSAK